MATKKIKKYVVVRDPTNLNIQAVAVRWDPLATGGNTELEATLLRASDLSDIFTLGLFVLEVIDFRTIIDRAVERQLVLLRAISDKKQTGF